MFNHQGSHHRTGPSAPLIRLWVRQGSQGCDGVRVLCRVAAGPATGGAGFLVPWKLLWNQLGWSNGFQIFGNWRTSTVAVFWDQICRVQHRFGKRNATGKDFEMQRLRNWLSCSWLIEPSSQQGALATLHSAREQATWMNLGNSEWCLLDVVLQNIPKRSGLILYIIIRFISFVISCFFSNRLTPTYSCSPLN
jgi:hypothetical protein